MGEEAIIKKYKGSVEDAYMVTVLLANFKDLTVAPGEQKSHETCAHTDCSYRNV